MIGPLDSKPLRESTPSRLAAESEKSGAREPMPRVSVTFCIFHSTLRETRKRNKTR